MLQLYESLNTITVQCNFWEGNPDWLRLKPHSLLSQMKVTFTFPGEFNALENSAKLVQGIIYNLAEYAKVDHEDVEITDIREGSIILEVIIRIPSDMSRENMGNFAIALTEQPQEVFTDDFIEEFGIPIVQVKISSECAKV